MMGHQQGRGEALRSIVPSLELEINLQGLRFLFLLLFYCQPERVLEKGESCRRRGAEKKRVHFQGLFVLFLENVLG